MHHFSKFLFIAALFVGAITLPASKARAYPVDCAILLCLAGGWPPSAECAHARAVFIRRITPWPVEPPLQIWRCPMKASLIKPEPKPLRWRLIEAAHRGERADLVAEPYMLRSASMKDLLHRISKGADIDISDPAFDFVRSIKVWHLRIYWKHVEGKSDNCRTDALLELGYYGTQGDFHWKRESLAEAPEWLIPAPYRAGCSVFLRAVGVEWQDYTGKTEYEWIRY